MGTTRRTHEHIEALHPLGAPRSAALGAIENAARCDLPIELERQTVWHRTRPRVPAVDDGVLALKPGAPVRDRIL